MRIMDQQSAAMSGLSGVEADLVHLAPTAPGDVLPRESIELRTFAFHAA
jgi:hypothetical protein